MVDIPVTEIVVLVLLFVASFGFLAAVFREAPEFEEVCAEPGCYRVATHERPEGVIDGTPVEALVCRRHGRVRRTV